MKYTPEIDRPHPMGFGSQAVYKFPNNYGASVVRSAFTYGGSQGLFELAVVRWEKDDYRITYGTPITDDVIGYLTAQEVDAYLQQIAELPKDAA